MARERCVGDDCCIETVFTGGAYYILDTKDYGQGPVAVIQQTEYGERLEKVVQTGEARAMFNESSEYKGFTERELRVYAAYATAGRLACLKEGQIITTFGDMHDLAPEQRLFPAEPSV